MLFKSLRLTALADAPYAFDETLEEAKRMPDSRWKAVTERNSEGKEFICALAFNSKEPIGMASGFLDQDDKGTAHMAAVWVDPGFRGKGLAEGLITFISDWAKIARIVVLTAEVDMHNPRAQAFYRKIGFELSDEQPSLVQDHTKSRIPIRKILKVRKSESQPNQPISDCDDMEALERREDPREDCFIPITFSFEDRAYTKFVRNISSRGMYIESDAQILKGCDLALSYHLPEKGGMKRVGKVVWTTPEGMGVLLQ